MPRAQVNSVELHYLEQGRGEHTVVFSHGLLWSSRMYEAQIAELSRRYRCIAWDHRGQGRSGDPGGRSHQIETCYQDALALLDHLEVGSCHFVGLSMGGFVGMRLAARHPERVRSLALLSTAADPEPKANGSKYSLLNLVARTLGVAAVSSQVAAIMMGPSFLEDGQRSAERRRWLRELRGNSRGIYRAVNGVIEREGCVDELANIRCPVLVLHGDEDRAISRARALATYEAVPDARFMAVASAGHSPTFEAPQVVNEALLAFYGELDRPDGATVPTGSGDAST